MVDPRHAGTARAEVRAPAGHARRRRSRALDDADVIVYLVDATDGHAAARSARPPGSTHHRARRSSMALNKIDALTPPQREQLARERPDAMLISALTGDGVDELLDARRAAPAREPVPLSRRRRQHAVGALLRRRADARDGARAARRRGAVQRRRARSRSFARVAPVYIRAVIYVERDSQKRILIGAQGRADSRDRPGRPREDRELSSARASIWICG